MVVKVVKWVVVMVIGGEVGGSGVGEVGGDSGTDDDEGNGGGEDE